MKRRKKALCALALCLLLIAAVFLLGLGGAQKTWEDLPYTLLEFEGGRAIDLAQGGSYGEMNRGPGLTLPAGEYRLKWAIDGDGDNVIRITSGNGAAANPAEIPVTAGSGEGSCLFTLDRAAENVQIRVDFASGTRIDVRDMRLYSPMYRDGAFAFALLAAGAYALYVLHLYGRLGPKARGRLILVGMAVLIASGPALKNTIGIGHDTTFHLVRLCNLADGLAHGQFPVRAGGYAFNGYGAITSVFYPDVFLYIPAMMMNLGASLPFAVNAFFVAVNALSAAAMYVSAKRIFREEWAAVCASILYTLSIYRISDVFTRYAFGEMTAMVFLPLFLLGLYEVVWGEKRSWPLLGASAACIFLSHMLSTVICALTAVGVCALFIVRIIREGRILPIAKACAAAGLLCAFQLVPFITYSLEGIGAQELAKDPAFYALHPAQLFLLGAGELSGDPADWRLSTFALEIGLPLIMGAGIALYAAAAREAADTQTKKKDGFAVLLVCAGVLFAVMATTLFPWSHVRVLTRGLSDYLQFPWRFLMMTAALFALAGGYGLAVYARGHGEQMAAAVLAVAALCALPTLTDEARNNHFIAFGETVSPNWQYTEYTLPGTKTAATLDPGVRADEGVELAQVERDGLAFRAQVRAADGGEIALPLFGYDGYRAELDGQALEWTAGEDNRLTVKLPAGADGELRVYFAGKALWRAAEGVSLLTAAGLAAMALLRKRKESGADKR